MAHVGQEIRRRREERSWSQAKLGVESGVGPSGISLIETGRRNPSAASLQRIAEALGVEVPDLFPKTQAPALFEPDERRRFYNPSEEERLAELRHFSQWAQAKLLHLRHEREHGYAEFEGLGGEVGIPAGQRVEEMRLQALGAALVLSEVKRRVGPRSEEERGALDRLSETGLAVLAELHEIEQAAKERSVEVENLEGLLQLEFAR